jgi:hypothetical protein
LTREAITLTNDDCSAGSANRPAWFGAARRTTAAAGDNAVVTTKITIPAPAFRRRRPASSVIGAGSRWPAAIRIGLRDLPRQRVSEVLRLSQVTAMRGRNNTRYDRSCEGFRMPAGRSVASSTEGRRPKAAREGTRGGRARLWGLWGFNGCRRSGAAQGTGLMEARDGLVAERSRQAWRRVRSRAPRPVDVGAIGGPGRRIDRTRVESGCCRRCRPPAGLRCGEALLGVMPPRS